ncbi:CAunnamed protein product [Biomphalaria glabrata]|nr:CAunnamed protein product [Biomphalaria glabrata]
MKNYHSLLIGFMKLDGWPRSGLSDRSAGQASLAHLPVPPSTGHKCHVITEESSHEVEVDNINEMLVDNSRMDSVVKNKLCRMDNCEHGEEEDSNRFEVNLNNASVGSRFWNTNELLKTCSYLPSDRNYYVNQHNKKYDSKWNHDSSEIKSGLLVMIQSQNNFQDSGTSTYTSHVCTPNKTPPCLRCPVLVQIHQKSFERYAIVTRAGHQASAPSLYLKLKKSRVTASNSNPCQFIVTFDNADGHSYRFEASTKKSAEEWIKAFTNSVHNFPIKSKRSQDVFHSLEILPESPVEYEDPVVTAHSVCTTSRSPKKRLTRQSSLTSKAMPTLSESIDEDDSQC